MEEKITAVIPDHEYWKKQIKCQSACPVGTDSRGYVIAIAEGRYRDAYAIARGPNPFASICGRVCGAPCEANCRRGSLDEPVSIRALKRFVTEMNGVESIDPGNTIELSAARRDGSNPKAGAKIAIIGAGVAGLTAAHDLALLGYDVTVFESGREPGGMLMTGVPIYRLPRKLVRQEIDAILSLGITLKLNTTVGTDLSIPELRNSGFEAILIAAGLQKSRALAIDGGELKGVVHGIEFLKKVNLGEMVRLGDKVVVIGGGNVAFDVARTALRAGADDIRSSVHDFYEAADAARLALRSGSREVHLVCLESPAEMPADEIEILEGVEEGVVIHTSRGPARIIEKGGRVYGLQTKIVKSVFGSDGKFNPIYDDKAGEFIEADTIIFAVGQAADFNFLNGSEGINAGTSSLLDIDKGTMQSKVPYIFACGDIAQGAGLFINAIASGQKAARSIDGYISGRNIAEEESFKFETIEYSMPDGYLRKKRDNPSVIDAGVRSSTMNYIEENYGEKTAHDQGERCLKCHINTIFDGDRCILCGGCVDVCPMNCLSLVRLSDLNISGDMEHLINNSFELDIRSLTEELTASEVDSLGSVMIKNEERCIRCGFCAKRCPVQAITMESFSITKRCVCKS